MNSDLFYFLLGLVTALALDVLALLFLLTNYHLLDRVMRLLEARYSALWESAYARRYRRARLEAGAVSDTRRSTP